MNRATNIWIHELRNTSNLSIFQPDGFLFFKQAGRSSGRVRPPGLFLLGLSKAVALTAGRDHKKATHYRQKFKWSCIENFCFKELESTHALKAPRMAFGTRWTLIKNIVGKNLKDGTLFGFSRLHFSCDFFCIFLPLLLASLGLGSLWLDQESDEGWK